MLRKKKRDYFAALDPRSVNDNQKIWKILAPYFSSKSKVNNKILLNEGNKLFNNDLKCAETFNTFFNCIVKKIKIPIDDTLLEDVSLTIML